MHLSNHQLTYCLNVHPGESWTDQFSAIKEYVPALKKKVCPNSAFGLGLRVSAEAVEELLEGSSLSKFKSYLDENDLYAFTINGFPYGAFHDAVVKEKVYQPDWSTVERLEYTLKLADILAALLPEDSEGSISTVPLSFKGWMKAGDLSFFKAIEQLAHVALHLEDIEQELGRYIHLGLEPEPCCFLETTEETIRFFEEALWTYGAEFLAKISGSSEEEARGLLQRYIGVCFDCCHIAIQYENLASSLKKLEGRGILISKVHLSAALELENPKHLDLLEPFVEPTYLHQVKGRSATGIKSWKDLPEALDALPKEEVEDLRVHFHVPLCWKGSAPLKSTRSAMDDFFWAWIRTQKNLHLEIETYTFDVLPSEVKPQGLGDSLAAEFEWVISSIND